MASSSANLVSSGIVDAELGDRHFRKVVDLLYKHAGIALTDGKHALVTARLRRRLRALRINDFTDYLKMVEAGPADGELRKMIDVLTTNKTSFFREEAHFRFLVDSVIPGLDQAHKRLRIWSAGCSSGQEAYTIAMVLQDNLPNFERWDVQILATDISDRVLDDARKGVYEDREFAGVPKKTLLKHFDSVLMDDPQRWAARAGLKMHISFARLNLMETWPMKGPFDVIFCRNVMIYFDKPTQEKLVNRYYDLLGPGGHLLIGHSESITGLKHKYEYLAPATYRRSA